MQNSRHTSERLAKTTTQPVRGEPMNFLRRAWNRIRGHNEPVYEPAGIVHYGEFRLGDYYAQATPNGTHHVWHTDAYLGEYPGPRIEIVEHLHAKDQR